MIGLDTTALIDLFKGIESLKGCLTRIKEPVAVTQMSYLEHMFSINPASPKHKEEEAFYDDVFSSCTRLSLTDENCKKASQLHWQLRKQGKTLQPFDGAIAAMFLTNGVHKIITRNAKHFSNISGLDVITY